MSDERTPEPKVIDTEIRRDHTFFHGTADSGVVVDLGRDMELGFLRIGPRPSLKRLTVDGDEESTRIKFEPDTIEIARVRLAPAVALQICMTLLERLKEGDHINADVLRPVMVDILNETQESDGTGQ